MINEPDAIIEEVLQYNLNNLHPRNEELKTVQWYIKKLWNNVVELYNLFVNIKNQEGSYSAFYSSLAIVTSHLLVLTFPHFNKDIVSVLYGVDTINVVVNDILDIDVEESKQYSLFFISCSKDIIYERPYDNHFDFLVGGLFFHCVYSGDENNQMWKILFEGPYPLTVILNTVYSTFEYIPFIHRSNDYGLSFLRFLVRVMETIDKSKCNVNDTADFSQWIHFLTESIKYPNIKCVEQWIRCFVRLFVVYFYLLYLFLLLYFYVNRYG